MKYWTVSYDGVQLSYDQRRDFQDRVRYAVVGPGMEIVAVFLDPDAAIQYAERLEKDRETRANRAANK